MESSCSDKSMKRQQVQAKRIVTMASKGHVMISYQWDFQAEVQQIYDQLTSFGFKVWMDKAEMSGDIYKKMSGAVEEASVVVICMSSKYQTSKNCQREFEYAQVLNKKMIPIKLEKGFQPAGALGLITAGKFYINFTDPQKFDENMENLKKEIESMFEESEESAEPNTVATDQLVKKLEDLDLVDLPEKPPTDKKVTDDKDPENITDVVHVHSLGGTEEAARYNIIIYGGNVVFGNHGMIDVERERSKSHTSNIATDARRSASVAGTSSLGNNGSGSGETIEERPPYLVWHTSEHFRDGLAGRLFPDSPNGNWIKLARHFKIEEVIIDQMRVRSSSHRLFFIQLRNKNPDLQIAELCNILHGKKVRNFGEMKNVRRDIKNIPIDDDLKLEDLSDEQFELLLAKVADKLIVHNVKGHWRHLASCLRFRTEEIELIDAEGKSEGKNSARLFIDYLCERGDEVEHMIKWLKEMKRNDLVKFIQESIDRGICWEQNV
eukprot:Seg2231.6 transcript_id=Seg2231.6/GoldUCD/mRNA.D3Y31 product="hypothetical protein" protein_id=Seg2231.6/GoldUCD/D3Y31